jgi:hypothetical protein
MTDLVGRNEVNIEYCNTDEMIGDFNMKPVVEGVADAREWPVGLPCSR